MKDFLSSYGDVLPVNKSNFLKLFFFINKEDYIFFNWIENSIIKNRKFSIFGFIKVLFIMVLFRLSRGNSVFVKHNNYPHDCCEKDISMSMMAISIFEKIANYVIVHSLPDVRNTRFNYVPHPLYKEISDPSVVNEDSDTYLIFGRILPYKKIEYVIDSFPINKKLIIAGACDDLLYLNKLEKLTSLRPNIKIVSKFLDHTEIEVLVKKCAGILITHNDNDMIVSGSFFYAMTLRSKVFALETPFFKWVEEEMGRKYVSTFKNLSAMLNEIELGVDETSISKSTMIDLFGEKNVHHYLSIFFNVNNA